MKILGISGLEGSVPFKKAHWPNLDPREYRMSQGHDAAAALVIDGKIIAATAEERFDRYKQSAAFPIRAIQYCLDEAGISLAEIDRLAHAFDYSAYRALYSGDEVASELYRDVYSPEAFLRLVNRDLPGFPPSRVCHVRHHLAHAASAYFTSGWEECLVIVADGMGELAGVTVYRAEHGNLIKLREIPAADSIGILYSLVTFHLGFDFNSDEYKIMGLAPYGDPQRFGPFFQKAVILRPDGTFRIPLLRLNRTREEQETHLASRQYLTEHLIPPRAPDAPVTQEHCDVAAALQAILETTMQHLCVSFGTQTGLRRVALAGGVALNCSANGKLLRSHCFDEIYIPPAAGDDGSALGAALRVASVVGPVENIRVPVPFLGPASSRESIDAALEQFRDRIDIFPCGSLDETCELAARQIRDGQVIAWWRGRMEFGPRALGNRSILADPARAGMRDRINSMVKKREAFRPFAPAVSLEQSDRWFDIPAGIDLRYMTLTVDVREKHRARFPAITHVNGSARVQTVSATDNPVFHTLLRAVGRATGCEMLLNTSFNVKGQPIVNTAAEALETFLATEIDCLFLGNRYIRRRERRPSEMQITSESEPILITPRTTLPQLI